MLSRVSKRIMPSREARVRGEAERAAAAAAAATKKKKTKSKSKRKHKRRGNGWTPKKKKKKTKETAPTASAASAGGGAASGRDLGFELVGRRATRATPATPAVAPFSGIGRVLNPGGRAPARMSPRRAAVRAARARSRSPTPSWSAALPPVGPPVPAPPAAAASAASSSSASRYFGVNREVATGRYAARCRLKEGGLHLIGVFDDELDAARAFDAFAQANPTKSGRPRKLNNA